MPRRDTSKTAGLLSRLPKPLRSYVTSIVLKEFHRLYYDSEVWLSTFWMGTSVQKCPLDLWIYQELMLEVKPDVVIECGTCDGGSTLFCAGLCDLLRRGRVITIDIEDRPGRPKHKRITYLLGSSTSDKVVRKVRRLIKKNEKVMVLLDSDHAMSHVMNELRIYSQFVSPGSYLVVEDTNINGHPVLPEFGPGPMEALQNFLQENDAFAVDNQREKFYLTFNPKGYLKRIR